MRILAGFSLVALMAGCGRTIPIDQGETESGTGSTTGSTSVGPSTTVGPTSTTSTTTDGECNPPCAPEYVCIDGFCEWEPCAIDPVCCGDMCCLQPDGAGNPKLRCRPEPECFADADCPEGTYCQDGYFCQPAQELDACAGFTSGTSLIVNGAGPGDLAGFDANGDDNRDVAWAREPLEVRIGDTLNPIGMFPLGFGPGHVEAGDVQGAGAHDLLVAQGSGLHHVHGNGGGGFTPNPPFMLPAPARDLHAADLDGDGRDDAVLMLESGEPMVAYTDGSGLLDTALLLEGPGVAGTSVTTFDLTHNGLADVIATYEDVPGLVVYENLGETFFRPSFSYDGFLPARRLVRRLGMTGFAQFGQSLVAIHEANDWTFVAVYEAFLQYPIVYGIPGRFGGDAEALDANGDGAQDLVLGGADGFAVLFSDGGRGLKCSAVRDALGVTQVAGTDVDGDGRDDVVYVTPDRLSVSYAN